jgi:hypothetical protein
MVTIAVVDRVPRPPDLTEARMAAYQALIDAVDAKERQAASTETAAAIKAAQAFEGWRAIWRTLTAWLAVAKVSAPATLLAALKKVETGRSFSPARARSRAEDILAILTHVPEDFTANGLTKVELEASITAQLALDADAAAAEVAAQAALEELKEADKALDRENKSVFAILAANFPDRGTATYGLVHGIPTETAPHHADDGIHGPEDVPAVAPNS